MTENKPITPWTTFDITTDIPRDFDNFINLITTLEDSNNPAHKGLDINNRHWVKWKDYCGQIVIETPLYYYKIYEMPYVTGYYIAHFREELGKIYREQGIKWEIITVADKQKDKVYQIEQREKLEVCNSSHLSYPDLLLNWNNTLKELENRVQLPVICAQLKSKIPGLVKIKLMRDCVNKYEDYAIKDGRIILLDDADWFLALVDDKGRMLEVPFNVFELEYPEECCLAPINYFDLLENCYTKEELVGVRLDKWCLFVSCGVGGDKFIGGLREEREKMLRLNCLLMATEDKNLLAGDEIKAIEYSR